MLPISGNLRPGAERDLGWKVEALLAILEVMAQHLHQFIVSLAFVLQ